MTGWLPVVRFSDAIILVTELKVNTTHLRLWISQEKGMLRTVSVDGAREDPGDGILYHIQERCKVVPEVGDSVGDV